MRLKVGGAGAERKLELTVDDLKTGYEKVELAAVCQCSGNRRGFSDPHVPGVEWGNGTIGNAKWGGVRLKDVLDKAGLKKEARAVSFNVPMARSSTRRRISSRAFRCGRRPTRTR